MSMATSYRYEAMAERKNLKKALLRQQERIRVDEMMASREQDAKLVEGINLKSKWNEELEHAATIQEAKTGKKVMKSEMKAARKASLMVRQAALRKLLDTEYIDWEKELHDQGKAFYIKRT